MVDVRDDGDVADVVAARLARGGGRRRCARGRGRAPGSSADCQLLQCLALVSQLGPLAQPYPQAAAAQGGRRLTLQRGGGGGNGAALLLALGDGRGPAGSLGGLALSCRDRGGCMCPLSAARAPFAVWHHRAGPALMHEHL